MLYILSTVMFTALLTALLLVTVTRYRITRREPRNPTPLVDRKLHPSPTPDFIPPVYDEDTHMDYAPHLRLLLHQIGHRYERPQPPNRDFLETFHDWIHFTLGPALAWNSKKLDAVEDGASSLAERFYPYGDTEMKMLMGKMTAMGIVIDDSVDDNDMYNEVERFAHRVYHGEVQPPGILRLFHENLMKLSSFHEGDAVLRGLAVVPWINFADGCLLEKRILTEDPTLRASPLDMGFKHLSKDKHDASLSSTPSSSSSHAGKDASGIAKCKDSDGRPRLTPLTKEAMKFPHYLRYKTGIAEAYIAPIFKANKDQELPLSRYIRAMPDMMFFTEALNDLMSFHKEELAGETSNLVHLRTQVFRSAPPCNGSGPSGEWTVSDTIRVLCEEARDAAHRIDTLLQLEENEMRDRKNKKMGIKEADADIHIAKQWRGYRDGYISWHLELPRYKLDFLRPQQFRS